MIQPDRELPEAEAAQRVGDRAENVRLDHGRRRPDRIDIALKELAEPSARRPVRAPHRLNLIPFEDLRDLVLILRDDARERHREVVPEREIGFAGVLVLAALEDLEDQLVAFLAVLPEQRLDVLERRRLERLEAVALVHTSNDVDDVFPPTDVIGKKVAGSARRLGRHVGRRA